MAAAKPEVSKGKKFTAIWIIPLAAVIIGAWMVVWTYLHEGPEIRVRFNNANGITEGKTVVKFRDVEMGQVQQVVLSDDMQSVTAIIKMRKEAAPMLREDTRFWVVTARIGGGSISGLETILTGAYIELAPGLSDTKSRDFVGLEDPPLTPADAPGIRLTLVSERSASISTGDPVLYHGFKVGRVESLEFDAEARRIRNEIFIDAPYDKLVTSTTRFWDVSGITLSTGADGIKIDTGSLETILLGGVTFDVPPGLEPGDPVETDTEFRLFDSYGDILQSPHQYREYYVVAFKQSVKGLLPGSPVEYRGIQIGEVEKVMMQELVDKGLREEIKPRGVPIPILIYIEPARFALPDTQDSLDLMRDVFSRGVKQGMRATLGKSSLLTGAQFVELDYFDDVVEGEMGEFEGYTTIPTILTGLAELEHKLTYLMQKAGDLPLEELVNSANIAVGEMSRSASALRIILENKNLTTIPNEAQAVLEALRTILEDDDTNAIPDEAHAALEALRTLLEDEGLREVPDEINDTLEAARFQLQGQSSEVFQLNKTLKEVELAARALREFLDYLEREPESLIRGKSDTNQ